MMGYGAFQILLEYESPKSFNQVVRYDLISDPTRTFLILLLLNLIKVTAIIAVVFMFLLEMNFLLLIRMLQIPLVLLIRTCSWISNGKQETQ